MAVNEFATALIAMDDDDVRAHIAKGDLSAFGHTFTDEERTLLVEAAQDDPEVVLFGSSFGANPRNVAAIGYVTDNQSQLSPQIRVNFGTFLRTNIGWSKAFGDTTPDCPSCQ
ncbi:hypothetical protein [Smaragdicoccus niigatensis]|uniref:hypothetical protein n=1 Tax=Smaragdicoccus niigatensis TaxID=359359 RepID=UPI00036FE5BA|nr:hypothetical protein [Smaragdicoccus niigatensis]